MYHFQTAYISHTPNRYPDFQQQIQLDEIPQCVSNDPVQKELYQEALRRGVVIFLPSIESGGKPVQRTDQHGNITCLDPLKSHRYKAIT